MQGDQLSRQWRTIRAIEASPIGLTVTEIAQREETGFRTIYRDLGALQAAGFPLYTEKIDWTNRWAFIGPFKFRILPPFALIGLNSLYFCRDPARVLKGTPVFYPPVARFLFAEWGMVRRAIRKKPIKEDSSLEVHNLFILGDQVSSSLIAELH